MRTPARPLRVLLEWAIRVGGGIGLILLGLRRIRDVPGREPLELVGLLLVGVAVVWTLWNRFSSYSEDNQSDEDATVTLGLNRRDKDNESAN